MTKKPSIDPQQVTTILTPEIFASGCAVITLILGFNAVVILLASCAGGLLAIIYPWARNKILGNLSPKDHS